MKNWVLDAVRYLFIRMYILHGFFVMPVCCVNLRNLKNLANIIEQALKHKTTY
jgi:hypothetical protein